jgi:cytochrome c oxidase subunit 1
MSEHATTAPAHGAAHHGHVEPNWFLKYFYSTDHKIIAFQYMFTGMAMAMIAGFMAYVFRMQIAFPGQSVPLFGFVSPNTYNALITNHGSIMVFWVAMPVLIAGLRQLPDPAHVRLRRHGVPAHQPAELPAVLLERCRALGLAVRAGRRLRRRMDGLPAALGDPKYNLTPMGSTMWVIAVALEFVAFLWAASTSSSPR